MDEWVMLTALERYRFSLAHEVAHYWLHDELYQDSTITSVRDWAAVQSEIGEEAYKWFEWQANNLAGLILVPKDELHTKFLEVKEKMRDLGAEVSKIDHHPVRQGIIRGLATVFAVGEQTMGIRLEKDNLLAPLAP